MNRIAAVVAGLTLAFVGTSATIAGTINVPGDYPTIQGAIEASVDGDVIQISGGIYNEYVGIASAKSITIQGTVNADGSLATTIDAQQNSSVFYTQNQSSEFLIKNLVITGGFSQYGGGIVCVNSNPTIMGCTISGNTANIQGGGLYLEESNPVIINCKILDNTAKIILGGGGIYCDFESSPTITGCTISNNNSGTGAGGGITCDRNSNPTITDCTISGNVAGSNGGGISCYDYSDPTITDCTISGNTANNEGGGIYHSSTSNSILSDTIVCGNAPDQIEGPWTDDGGNTVQEFCPIFPGACCTGNELFCVPDAEEDDCLFWGGEWLGEATSCDDCAPPVEPDPTGACCLSGGCVRATNIDCFAGDGTYAGDDVACADVNCATTCIGDANGDGEVSVNDILLVISQFGVTCP